MKYPLFSIAIPTFNRLELLKKAVESALEQTYQNIELLVLNNASTDGTKEWLDDLSATCSKIKVIHNSTNIGGINNIKSMPQYINGKYLVVLSDDDLLDSKFVSTAVNDLIRHDDAVVWYCRANVIDVISDNLSHLSREAPLIEDGYIFVKESLLGKREALLCTTVLKVATLREIGGFIGEDLAIDFITRSICAAKGKVLYNPNVLASYYLHPQGSLMLSASLWFRAGKEIQLLITKYIGRQYKFASIYYRFLIMESFLNRKGMRLQNRFYCLYKLFFEHPFWFLVICMRRFPYLVARLLPESLYTKVYKFYWQIRGFRKQDFNVIKENQSK